MKCECCDLDLTPAEPCTGSTVRMESEIGTGGTGLVRWSRTVPEIYSATCDECENRGAIAQAETVRSHFGMSREQWDSLSYDQVIELHARYEDWEALQD